MAHRTTSSGGPSTASSSATAAPAASLSAATAASSSAAAAAPVAPAPFTHSTVYSRIAPSNWKSDTAQLTTLRSYDARAREAAVEAAKRLPLAVSSRLQAAAAANAAAASAALNAEDGSAAATAALPTHQHHRSSTSHSSQHSQYSQTAAAASAADLTSSSGGSSNGAPRVRQWLQATDEGVVNPDDDPVPAPAPRLTIPSRRKGALAAAAGAIVHGSHGVAQTPRSAAAAAAASAASSIDPSTGAAASAASSPSINAYRLPSKTQDEVERVYAAVVPPSSSAAAVPAPQPPPPPPSLPDLLPGGTAANGVTGFSSTLPASARSGSHAHAPSHAHYKGVPISLIRTGQFHHAAGRSNAARLAKVVSSGYGQRGISPPRAVPAAKKNAESPAASDDELVTVALGGSGNRARMALSKLALAAGENGSALSSHSGASSARSSPPAAQARFGSLLSSDALANQEQDQPPQESFVSGLPIPSRKLQPRLGEDGLLLRGVRESREEFVLLHARGARAVVLGPVVAASTGGTDAAVMAAAVAAAAADSSPPVSTVLRRRRRMKRASIPEGGTGMMQLQQQQQYQQHAPFAAAEEKSNIVPSATPRGTTIVSLSPLKQPRSLLLLHGAASAAASPRVLLPSRRAAEHPPATAASNQARAAAAAASSTTATAAQQSSVPALLLAEQHQLSFLLQEQSLYRSSRARAAAGPQLSSDHPASDSPPHLFPPAAASSAAVPNYLASAYSTQPAPSAGAGGRRVVFDTEGASASGSASASPSAPSSPPWSPLVKIASAFCLLSFKIVAAVQPAAATAGDVSRATADARRDLSTPLHLMLQRPLPAAQAAAAVAAARARGDDHPEDAALEVVGEADLTAPLSLSPSSGGAVKPEVSFWPIRVEVPLDALGPQLRATLWRQLLPPASASASSIAEEPEEGGEEDAPHECVADVVVDVAALSARARTLPSHKRSRRMGSASFGTDLSSSTIDPAAPAASASTAAAAGSSLPYTLVLDWQETESSDRGLSSALAVEELSLDASSASAAGSKNSHAAAQPRSNTAALASASASASAQPPKQRSNPGSSRASTTDVHSAQPISLSGYAAGLDAFEHAHPPIYWLPAGGSRGAKAAATAVSSEQQQQQEEKYEFNAPPTTAAAGKDAAHPRFTPTPAFTPAAPQPVQSGASSFAATSASSSSSPAHDTLAVWASPYSSLAYSQLRAKLVQAPQ